MKRLLLLPLLLVALAAPQVATSQTTAASALSVSGRVVGADGAPMKLAHVHLMHASDKDTSIASNVVSADGSYAMNIPGTGAYALEFTGVSHQAYTVPLLITATAPIRLDVQLAANEMSDDPPSIIGDFNDFDFQSAEPMRDAGNGTWAATLPAKNGEVGYQIMKSVEGHSVNGTMADRFEYDGGGDYRSIVKASGPDVTIVYDPSKMPAPHGAAVATFADQSSVVARFATLDMQTNALLDDIRSKMVDYQRKYGTVESFSYPIDSELDRLLKQMDAEKSPIIRQALALEYVQLAATTRPKYVDKDRLAKVIPTIEPASPLNAMMLGLIERAYAMAGLKNYDAYASRMIKENPDRGVKSAALFENLVGASYAGDLEKTKLYYTQLTKDFSDTPYGKYAENFSPDRDVMPGKPVPDFSFTSLKDSTVTYSRTSMLGQYYMIDFWATWCGPCRGELPGIESAYQKFKGHNFQILSLSFDRRPEDIAPFRAKYFPMEWVHGFVNGGFRSDLAKTFEVAGIPKPILVGPDGMILATEGQLRGENLEKTLRKYVLGEQLGDNR